MAFWNFFWWASFSSCYSCQWHHSNHWSLYNIYLWLMFRYQIKIRPNLLVSTVEQTTSDKTNSHFAFWFNRTCFTSSNHSDNTDSIWTISQLFQSVASKTSWTLSLTVQLKPWMQTTNPIFLLVLYGKITTTKSIKYNFGGLNFYNLSAKETTWKQRNAKHHFNLSKTKIRPTTIF